MVCSFLNRNRISLPLNCVVLKFFGFVVWIGVGIIFRLVFGDRNMISGWARDRMLFSPVAKNLKKYIVIVF